MATATAARSAKGVLIPLPLPPGWEPDFEDAYPLAVCSPYFDRTPGRLRQSMLNRERWGLPRYLKGEKFYDDPHYVDGYWLVSGAEMARYRALNLRRGRPPAAKAS